MIAVGSIAMLFMAQSKVPRHEVIEKIVAGKCGDKPGKILKIPVTETDANQALDRVLERGLLMELVDDILVTVKGKKFFQMLQDKVEVAIMASPEQSRSSVHIKDLVFSEDDIGKIKHLSEDIPG